MESEEQEVCCETVSPRHDREATPLIPEQYGCQDKSRTKTILIDMFSGRGNRARFYP